MSLTATPAKCPAQVLSQGWAVLTVAQLPYVEAPLP